MIFYLAYTACVFVSLFFLVCVFLCYDMRVSPAINTNNNNNNNKGFFRKICYLRPSSNLFVNVIMQSPGPDLLYVTMPGSPLSERRNFLVFTLPIFGRKMLRKS